MSASRGEAALQERWATAQGSPYLITEAGERLRLVFAGTWNHGPGPDFERARLLGLDGRMLRGDVEIHRRPEDWRHHGHHRDPAYAGVLLHVVEEASTGEIAGVPRPRLIVLGTGPEESSGHSNRGLGEDRAARPLQLPCQTAANRAGGRAVLVTLGELGRRRLLRKVATVQTRSRGGERDGALLDVDEVAYASALEAVAQVADREMTRALIQALPWSQLRTALERARASARRLEDRRPPNSLSAGGDGGRGTGGEVESIAERLTSTVDALVAQGVWRWPTRVTRPANSPGSRLRIVAGLLAKFAAVGEFPKATQEAPPTRIAGGAVAGWELGGSLAGLAWLGEKEGIEALRIPGLIGIGRARQLLVDLCYPLAVAFAPSNHEAMRLSQAWIHLGAARYGRTELLRRRLELNGVPVRRNGCSQGLLALERDYCREGACAICPLARLSRGPSRTGALPSTNL